MAKRHNDDGTEGGDYSESTEQKDGHTAEDSGANAEGRGGSTSRRTLLKTVGATAAALGGAGAFASSATAAGFTTSPSGEVTVDPGTYSWDGGMSIDSGDALIGGGSAGDVVVNLESGTMDGSIQGRLENIVVRGSNHSSKAGLDLYPGAVVDGFIWPEGGQQDEDRTFYAPTGGSDRVTLRNSAWAWMVNNGAYLDKVALTMENCAAVNNNIAGVRVGHRDGTSSSATTYIRNSLIAVTQDIEHDDTNSANARGVRLRQPGHLVIENCWFIYLDVDGPADLIELHDGAAGSTVEIRNCAFYNDSDGDLVRDKSDGQMDVTIENCTVAGSGSRNIEPDYSGSGVTEDGSVTFPLPSEITGYAAADEIDGVGSGIGPWDGETATVDDPDSTKDHTLVLHASSDNAEFVDVSFTVDGSIAYGSEAEPGTDVIESNDDGTVTATSIDMNPDALDSYRFDGEVVDYTLPSTGSVDVSLDGTATTFADLVGEETSGDSSDGSTDGSTDDSTSGDTTDGDTSNGDGSSDDSTTSTLSKGVTVDGRGAESVTKYTFTVSGDVVRDPDASMVTDDGTPWDELEDIANDGKVIGLVGSGVDAYRFDGEITSITVDGDANVSIDRSL